MGNDDYIGLVGLRGELQQCLAFLAVFLLVNATIAAPVLAQEGAGQPEPVPAVTTTAAQERTSVSCSITSLSDAEVQKLKEDIRKEGITGENISSGVKAEEVEKVEKNKVVLADEDNELAVEKEMPSVKVSPEQASWLLNRSIQGGFSFGLLLDDTLRVGKCTDLANDLNACALKEPATFYRNSGASIVSDVTNAWDAVYKDVFGGQRTDLSEADLKMLQDTYEAESLGDNNAVEATVGKRLKGEVVENVLETDDFDARMETPCNSSACAISIYSMFDKYFNSAFSTEMVGSIAGPMLWHRASKLFGMAKARLGGFWPFDLQSKAFYQKLDAAMMQPGSFLGQRRLQSMKARLNRFPEVKTAIHDMVIGTGGDSGYKAIKGGGFSVWAAKAVSPDGVFGKIKDPKLREELVKVIADYEGYLKTTFNMGNLSKARYGEAVKDAAKRFGEGTQEFVLAEKAARRDWARDMARIMQDVDDDIELDLPEYFMRKTEFGFQGVGVKNTKLGAGGKFQDLYEDSTNYDGAIFKPFIADGKWSPQNTNLELDEFGNIILYKMKPDEMIGEVSIADIDSVIQSAKYREMVTQLRDGTWINISDNTKAMLVEQGAPTLKVYARGWEKLEKPLTPDDLTSALTEDYVFKRMTKYGQSNMSELRNTLIENNFASRKYTSWLDKQFAQESELLYKYFSSPVSVGGKLTALPFVYWWIKKGFGFEEISFYRLPDTWKTVKATPGQEGIVENKFTYDDAYIDFFANEGSDQGDLFIRVINYLPWEMAYEYISKSFNPVHSYYEYATGQGRRDETGNLIFYLTGPRDCETCSITLTAPSDLSYVGPHIYSTEKINSFILEEPQLKEGKSQGSLLVAFTHHTDLSGKIEGESEGSINLLEALRGKNDEFTCREKAKELALGLDVGSAVGGVYALAENLSYIWFGWAGTFASFAAQILVASSLMGCTDTDEGYFIHFWSPPLEQKEEKASTQEVAMEKTATAVKQAKDAVTDVLKGGTDSVVSEKIDEMGQKIDEMARGATKSDLVQANVLMEGKTTGKVFGEYLFYLWLQPGFNLDPSKYRTEGKMVLQGKDAEGKAAVVEVNNETGQVTVNGKPVISEETSKDHVRLNAVNGQIPAVEIPQTLGHVGLAGSGPLFEIDIRGQAKVLDPAVLDCIKQAVQEQTGLALPSDNLADAFGRVESIVSNSHPQIKILPEESQIIFEGLPRETLSGADLKLRITSDRNVSAFREEERVFADGKLESIQFQNGLIVFNPEKNELLVWLKHHEQGRILGSDLVNFSGKATKVNNAVTDCPETAIEFEARGDPASELKTFKADQFNQSLKHMGPFQVMDTDKQTFIFYSEQLPDGTCVERFRVINKETGEVYDQAITSMKSEDGKIYIGTGDGQTHELGFSYENGKPILTYNGDPNTMMYAQGRNGSFWYDPEKGLWYAENAQLLPLLEAFRTQGLEFKGNEDGTASAAPGTSFMVLDERGSGPDFLANLPSLPESLFELMAFIALLAGVFVFTQQRLSLGRKR